MGQRLTIKQAATATGLTEYTLRQGIKQGRYPHIRTSGTNGKILVDISLLERYLEQEAMQNTMVDATSTANVINYGELRKVEG